MASDSRYAWLTFAGDHHVLPRNTNVANAVPASRRCAGQVAAAAGVSTGRALAANNGEHAWAAKDKEPLRCGGCGTRAVEG